jgi:hypothetical protein
MNSEAAEKKFFKLSVIFLISAIVIFTVTGIFRHNYYSYIIYRKAPLAYLQDILLFLCFLLSGINAYLSYKNEKKFNIVWLCMCAGFLYLTLDASLHIHQTLRESFFKPNGISVKQLFWVDKGDYVLIFLLAAGLCFTPFVLKELKKRGKAVIFFVTAVIFSAAAVAADSFDLHAFGYGFQKFLQYGEEMFESAAQICFLNSFFCAASGMLYPDKTQEDFCDRKRKNAAGAAV